MIIEYIANLIQNLLIFDIVPPFDTIQAQSEDEYTRVNSSNISGKFKKIFQ